MTPARKTSSIRVRLRTDRRAKWNVRDMENAVSQWLAVTRERPLAWGEKKTFAYGNNVPYDAFCHICTKLNAGVLKGKYSVEKTFSYA